MKLVKESIDGWKFKGEEDIRGLFQAGKNSSEDFKYSIHKNWLKIKKQISSDQFLMHTNWGPDIIIQIIGYDESKKSE